MPNEKEEYLWRDLVSKRNRMERNRTEENIKAYEEATAKLQKYLREKIYKHEGQWSEYP